VTDGTACGAAGICLGGACSAGSSLSPATSCKAILDTMGKLAKDGVYYLDPDGKAGPEPVFQAYCDMTSDGGGWTLVLKVDGTKSNFVYDSALWGNKSGYNIAATAMDFNEAKLPSYWSMPFTQLRVGLRTGFGDTQWLSINYAAKSLFEVIADGLYKTWTPAIGRANWKALVPQSTLQANCNREGFNNLTSVGWAAARIGIIANEQNDCGSPDSRLGIGLGGAPCGLDSSSAAGNGAGCGGDLGNYNIKSFGYVMLR
jgi:hypothetical protein